MGKAPLRRRFLSSRARHPQRERVPWVPKEHREHTVYSEKYTRCLVMHGRTVVEERGN